MTTTTGPQSGYAVTLHYFDHSGMIAAWGPFDTEAAAEAGIEWLKQLPLQAGHWAVTPLLAPPGAPLRAPAPVRPEESRVGTNSGHGHVWERPDGMKARCGGPGMCADCSFDQHLVADTYEERR